MKIDELIARRLLDKGEKLTYQDVAERALAGDITDPRGRGNQRKRTTKELTAFVRSWNRGNRMSALRLRHLLKLSKFFGTPNVNDLIGDADE